MKCKFCNKELYEHNDFRVLFKWNYIFHLDCEKSINKPCYIETIPIEQNVVHSIFFIEEDLKEINGDNILFFKGQNIVKAVKEISDWSIIYYYDENDFEILRDIDKYHLYKLSSSALIFISNKKI
jgi:hypothetical protein